MFDLRLFSSAPDNFSQPVTTVTGWPCHARLLHHSVPKLDISEYRGRTRRLGDGGLESPCLTLAGHDPGPQSRLRSVGAGEARRVKIFRRWRWRYNAFE